MSVSIGIITKFSIICYKNWVRDSCQTKLRNVGGALWAVCRSSALTKARDRSYVWPESRFWRAEWCIEALGMASTDVRGVYMTKKVVYYHCLYIMHTCLTIRGRSLKSAFYSRSYVWPALLATGHTYDRLLDRLLKHGAETLPLSI